MYKNNPLMRINTMFNDSYYDVECAIIGAGFSGIIAALKLQELGKTSFVILEQASQVGGTWRDNVYPGCACDVASVLYSISTQPNPSWAHTYSRQPEILAYMKDVVQKNNLTPHIRFNTRLENARFLENEGVWLLRDSSGRETRARMLIMGLGPFTRPNKPTFPKMDTFRGDIIHSAEWRMDVDLKGKRVAVIGTGASAIQIIPSIAPEVQSLCVVQRTPAWVMPRNDVSVSEFKKRMITRFPAIQRWQRSITFFANELSGQFVFVHNTPFRHVAEWLAKQHLRRQVRDTTLRKKLTPHYTIGCKRVLVSDDYYPTFNRDNVRLKTLPIQEFTEYGIRFENGCEEKYDVVILATGFHVADIDFGVEIYGLQGRNLMTEWKAKAAEAYYATMIAGYPNMALLLGPNSAGGHNSVIDIVEAQMHYVAEYFKYLEAQSPRAFLNLRADVQRAYNERMQANFRGTVWASGCESWYMNNEGRNTTLYPGINSKFRKAVKALNPHNYEVCIPIKETAGQ